MFKECQDGGNTHIRQIQVDLNTNLNENYISTPQTNCRADTLPLFHGKCLQMYEATGF